MSRTTRSNQSSNSIGDELQKYFESSAFQVIITKAVGDVLKEDSFQQFIKETVDTAVLNAIAPLNDKLAKVDSFIQQVTVMEEKLANLESKLISAEKDARSAAAKANDNEQYSRKYNLRFCGIEEKENENCVNSIVEFCNEKLGVSLTVDKFDRAHRVGKKEAGKTRSIMVKFINYNSKIAVCKCRKNLKGSNFYINEDLTQFNLRLFNFARGASSVKSVWFTDGKILVRGEDDKVFRVRSMTELEV